MSRTQRRPNFYRDQSELGGRVGSIQRAIAQLVASSLQAANNLSDLVNRVTARKNLGFYTTTVTVTFSAGVVSSTATINHNLGRIPVSMNATILGGDPGFNATPFMQNGGSMTTASLAVRASASNSATLTYSVEIVG